MKKSMKLMSMLLAVALVVAVIPMSAFATEATPVEDIYAQGMTEIVEIDGYECTYHYFYDAQGNRNITIQEAGSNRVETVTYVSKEGAVLMDGEMVATVTEVPQYAITSHLQDEGIVPMASDWVLLESLQRYITWAEGTTARALAAIIAVALAFTGVGAIYDMMGATMLYALAEMATEGTVYNNIYKLPLPTDYTLKEVWHIVTKTGYTTPSYTSYMPT